MKSRPLALTVAAFRNGLALPTGWHRLVSVLLHLVMIAVSNYAAWWLRFDGLIPPGQHGLMLRFMPTLLLVRGLTFFPLRLYDGLWRYTSIWDLRNILLGVSASTAAFFGIVQMSGVTDYPSSILLIDAGVLILLMGGARLSQRIARELSTPHGDRRLLLYGAGDAGEMIARELRAQIAGDYRPIGFIDDDVGKVGKRIHGLPVLGTRVDLASVIEAHKPDEVLVAMPHAGPSVLRGVVRALQPFKIPILTLPSLRELLDGCVVHTEQIRKLQVEDLLPRGPVGLDPRPVQRFIEGRVVLVTGAGGSIGSELCRQILASQPARLILLERHENSLYAIQTELNDKGFGRRVQGIVADITDRSRIDAVLQALRPAVVFHAAAHKHVPLMELSPGEAVKNNVRGTRLLADAAEQHGVEHFTQISTDKAVNPTSVMGATKRIAELALQARAVSSGVTFTTVRFGNVLGSSGSVVPRFLDQIKAGGPVTVTHPEIRRYFMLIPEAVQLVLHAAAQGEAGAVYVLEMGEQIRVLDLAQDLIRLSGFSLDEIAVRFVGLRPGEKLFEELVATNERAEASATDKVLRVTPVTMPDRAELLQRIAALEEAALAGADHDAVLEMIRGIVPESRLANDGDGEKAVQLAAGAPM